MYMSFQTCSSLCSSKSLQSWESCLNEILFCCLSLARGTSALSLLLVFSKCRLRFQRVNSPGSTLWPQHQHRSHSKGMHCTTCSTWHSTLRTGISSEIVLELVFHPEDSILRSACLCRAITWQGLWLVMDLSSFSAECGLKWRWAQRGLEHHTYRNIFSGILSWSNTS